MYTNMVLSETLLNSNDVTLVRAGRVLVGGNLLSVTHPLGKARLKFFVMKRQGRFTENRSLNEQGGKVQNMGGSM